MLKNSCFFIICRSYCSLPGLTFIVKMYFFVACEVTFIVKTYFSLCVRLHSLWKCIFSLRAGCTHREKDIFGGFLLCCRATFIAVPTLQGFSPPC